MSTEDANQLTIKKEPGTENSSVPITTSITSNVTTSTNIINPVLTEPIVTVQSTITHVNPLVPPIKVVTNQVLVKDENTNPITSLVPVTNYKPIDSFTPMTIVNKTPPIAVNVTPVQQTAPIVNSVTTTSSKTNSSNQTNGETSTNEDNEKTSSIVVLNKQRLQELVAEIDSNEQLDEDVEDMLLNIADDFIDNLVSNACLLAKHRGSKNVEVKDVQLILEKNYNMYIPGFGSLPLNEEFKNVYKKSPATEAHKQRMALIKKTLKKF